MRLEYTLDPSGDLIFSGRVADAELLNERIAQAIAQDIIAKITDAVVKEKDTEIMARVDLTAVANMIVVRVADRVASDLRLNYEPPLEK